jgi:hypothetical protein
VAPTSYQTIKLKKGRHESPEQGVCVMELASMLAGESFSDHPASVCPVIGSLLRSYNDVIDDRRRQDLYVYASKVVGSRGSSDVQLERIERLASWPGTFRPRRRLMPRIRRRHPTVTLHYVEAMTRRVIAAARRDLDAAHPHVLALVNELLEIGRVRPSVPDLMPESIDRPARPESTRPDAAHGSRTQIGA